jgi:hypothetical protein
METCLVDIFYKIFISSSSGQIKYQSSVVHDFLISDFLLLPNGEFASASHDEIKIWTP